MAAYDGGFGVYEDKDKDKDLKIGPRG